ncbi:MAG: phosphoribosylformylglycinamidine cyclo-ligase [Zavarzinella sp.]
MPPSIDYRSAGLDLDIYENTIGRIGQLVKRSHTPGVLGSFGGFASLFQLDIQALAKEGYQHPILVTCTDGVGTKLKVASMLNRFDTVGIDLVAMSVNDALCYGAKPLVFLDYLAMPKDDPLLAEQLVAGMAEGCVQAGCALTGGETAILPDFYAPGDFDTAGFVVAVVEKSHIIDGSTIQKGDVVLGLASTGLHSNGYSLARKIAFDHAQLPVDQFVPELDQTIGDALLTPTKIYVQAVLDVLAKHRPAVHGMAHITGGGIVDNLPRVLHAGHKAVVRRGSWPMPPIFTWLQNHGNVAEAEMDRVFNCGIGYTMVVAADLVAGIQAVLQQHEIPSWPIGEIVAGDPIVEWA